MRVNLWDAWKRIAEELVGTLVDYVDVIGHEIEDIPMTSRFSRADEVCHEASYCETLQITNVKLNPTTSLLSDSGVKAG
jgi:hypothetical protein